MSSSPVASPFEGTYALLEVNGIGNNWNPAGAYQIVQPVGGITAGATYTFSGEYLTDTGITWTGGGVGIQLDFLVRGTIFE